MKQGNSYHQKAIIEEHYILAGELYEFCITHVTPTNGTAKQIAQAIYNALENISMIDLMEPQLSREKSPVVLPPQKPSLGVHYNGLCACCISMNFHSGIYFSN